MLHREDTTDDMEREADAFAAEFLIRTELANLTLGKAVDLKRQWGVSVAALIQRAHQIGVLTDARRTSLFKQLFARGWRVREPASDEIAPEKTELLDHIATHLRGRGLLDHIATHLRGRGLNDHDVAHLAGYRSPDRNRLMPASTSGAPVVASDLSVGRALLVSGLRLAFSLARRLATSGHARAIAEVRQDHGVAC